MSHQCEALVLSCIDYRFQTPVRNWLIKNGFENKYDLVTRPGASKDADEVLLSYVELSSKLHGIKEVIVIHHQNCGAYGAGLESGSVEELAKHSLDMANSIKFMKSRLPELAYRAYFAKLDGTVENTA